jgi:hypothetical protein
MTLAGDRLPLDPAGFDIMQIANWKVRELATSVAIERATSVAKHIRVLETRALPDLCGCPILKAAARASQIRPLVAYRRLGSLTHRAPYHCDMAVQFITLKTYPSPKDGLRHIARAPKLVIKLVITIDFHDMTKWSAAHEGDITAPRGRTVADMYGLLEPTHNTSLVVIFRPLDHDAKSRRPDRSPRPLPPLPLGILDGIVDIAAGLGYLTGFADLTLVGAEHLAPTAVPATGGKPGTPEELQHLLSDALKTRGKKRPVEVLPEDAYRARIGEAQWALQTAPLM